MGLPSEKLDPVLSGGGGGPPPASGLGHALQFLDFLCVPNRGDELGNISRLAIVRPGLLGYITAAI